MFEVVSSLVSGLTTAVRSALRAVTRQPWIALLAVAAFAVALW